MLVRLRSCAPPLGGSENCEDGSAAVGSEAHRTLRWLRSTPTGLVYLSGKSLAPETRSFGSNGAGKVRHNSRGYADNPEIIAAGPNSAHPFRSDDLLLALLTARYLANKMERPELLAKLSRTTVSSKSSAAEEWGWSTKAEDTDLGRFVALNSCLRRWRKTRRHWSVFDVRHVPRPR